MLQIRRLFFALASRSGFGAAISDAVVRSSITFIVFCNSVFADRIVVAASGLLLAAAACVILLSFAAGLRKSYWMHEGCDSDLSADFLHFGAGNFPFKKCFKIVVFFSLWRRDPVLELQFLCVYYNTSFSVRQGASLCKSFCV